MDRTHHHPCEAFGAVTVVVAAVLAVAVPVFDNLPSLVPRAFSHPVELEAIPVRLGSGVLNRFLSRHPSSLIERLEAS